MRQLDENEVQPLGKKIEVPKPAPTPNKRNDGTIIIDADGKMRTNLPTPPLSIWELYGIKKVQG